MNTHYQTIIVGGGLSGLYAAYLLEQQQHDYLVLEARERLGGRIVSSSLKDNSNASVDMGPSWFWPNVNPRVSALIETLGINRYKQYGDGQYMIEKVRNAPAQALNLGYDIMPDTYRLECGMRALIDGLASKIPVQKYQLQSEVHQIAKDANGYYVITLEKAGETMTLKADNVLFAMPLRLIARNIAFEPPLDPKLQRVLDGTETWMAAHAKAVFLYEKPFWRAKGFSGSASSSVGPLVEIHDASPEINGEPQYGAIMGFVGINGTARKTAGTDTLKTLIQKQLVRLFGAEADAPIAVHYLDWFQEPFTATTDDLAVMHGLYGAVQQDSNHSTVFFAGTESSREYGGYLEGALDAAQRAVDAMITKQLPRN
ncbi:flavin monoamine oxidase family protein [Enterovibrio coralii]|uniref:Monoamine oxidase n=1 Tax=Enterovibrio coralii TaxID=294935 RepID=A0A135I8X3_9GAMM|nr:FAD-dependent oxidoreductase [Enterovibrio coralii]KXF81900.1 monoamine oxidase [Enterovibrio coralii]